MVADDGYLGGVDMRFVGGALDERIDPAEADRSVLHAVRFDSVEPLCGESRGPLLPTLGEWGRAPGGVLNCARCLSLAPLSGFARPREVAEAGRQTAWRYIAGANYLRVAENGVAFFLPGHGFFRPRRLNWDEVVVFVPEEFSLPGLSADKGAGTRFGLARAWRISLQRPAGRAVAVPPYLPDMFSEQRAELWASGMNSALALPRKR